MEQRVAQIISYVFHPAIMPTLAVFLLLNLDTYLNYTITTSGKIAVYSIVFINTALLPGLLTYIQYRTGLIRSLKMGERKERIMPFFISSIFYFFCFYILKKNNLPPPVYFLILGTALAVFAAFIINFFWKISIHSIGIGGIAGMLYGISGIMNVELTVLLLFTVFVAGLIGFARLRLNSHTPHQVYAGFLTGFGIIYLTLRLFL